MKLLFSSRIVIYSNGKIITQTVYFKIFENSRVSGSQGSVCDVFFPSFSTVNWVHVCFGFALTDALSPFQMRTVRVRVTQMTGLKVRGQTSVPSNQTLSQTVNT